MHPLYHHARRLVGQHVYVHAYGRVHHGVLHQVTPEGLYLQRVDGARTVSAPWEAGSLAQVQAELAPLAAATGDDAQAEQVWFPFFFLPWLAVAALGPWWW
ncbi:MAG: hypothetical protein OWT27_03190 [Firmicutes bacterium]|nr:hypothetical protein [Bacillota bacterium]